MLRFLPVNLTRAAAILAGVAALAALVAGAATARHDVPKPVVFRPAAIDRHSADLAKDIARLHERLRPDAAPRPQPRNLFSFHTARAVPAPAAPESRPAPVEAPVPAAPPSTPFKLVGIAEDPGANGPIRTAFISAEGQLFMAKEGEAITARFKVTKISADVAELTDVTDGSTHRLQLK
jgi:hypothetical protein